MAVRQSEWQRRQRRAQLREVVGTVLVLLLWLGVIGYALLTWPTP